MSKRSTERRALLGWVLPYVRQYFHRYGAAAIIGTLAVSSAAALLFTSGYLISRSALRPENILMVYVPIVLVRTFGFSKAILQYVERLIGHDAVLRTLSKLRIRLYQVLEPQALFLRSRFRTGDLLGLLAEDIEQLQNAYLRVILPSICSLLLYGGGIALLGQFDVAFAIMMAAYCGLLLFLAPLASLAVTYKKQRALKAERATTYQVLTDGLFGMRDWLLSGRSKSFLSAFQQQQLAESKLDGQLRQSEWRRSWLYQCLIGIGVAWLVWWAGDRAAAGHIEATWIAAFSLTAFPIMEAFVRSAEAIVRLPEYQDSLIRLQEVENASTYTNHLDEHDAAAVSVTTVPTEVTLSVTSVCCRYSPEAPWTLRDFSLHAAPGQRIAILGRSGAGKSTLLHLIQGALKPDGGEVLVDGKPIASYPDPARVFAVLNQQPYLFDTTVANNILLGKPKATMEKVQWAAQQAGIADLIESLPAGYQTRMEETGQRFSGGERQRVALARILLQNAPIVLLDEPTVGLDPITERDLMTTVMQTLSDKTLIWVTHHLYGLEQMDEIIFLDQGEVLMRGSHTELMSTEPRYRRLYLLDCPA